MGGKDTGENASDSGVSKSEAGRAEHQARDDAVSDGLMSRGGGRENSERFSKSEGAREATEAAGGFWSSVFGGGKK